MTQPRSQRGFLTLQGILFFLVVGAILFVAFKLVPPYVDNYQFQDSIESISRTATYNRMSEADIRGQVLDEAAELGIPLDANQVAVQKAGPNVNIAVEYAIPVDLLVYQTELQFAPHAGNRNIMARPGR